MRNVDVFTSNNNDAYCKITSLRAFRNKYGSYETIQDYINLVLLLLLELLLCKFYWYVVI